MISNPKKRSLFIKELFKIRPQTTKGKLFLNFLKSQKLIMIPMTRNSLAILIDLRFKEKRDCLKFKKSQMNQNLYLSNNLLLHKEEEDL